MSKTEVCACNPRQDQFVLPADLRKYFLIAERRQPLHDGWVEIECLGWWIGRDRNLPLHPVQRPDGMCTGIILGWVIEGDRLLQAGEAVRAPEPGMDLAEWSGEFAGQFLCLIRNADGCPQIILDAGGMLAAVYDPDRRAIASIPALLPGGARQDEELIATFGPDERHKWYPFGLTPALGVRRLLPNFALALDDFRTERIWPLPDSIPDQRPEHAIAEIFSLTARNAHAIAGRGNFIAHITAGYDSRMILAAIGATRAKNGTFITIDLPNPSTALDVRVAGRLAENLGFQHEIRPYLPATIADQEAWRIRTGACVMSVNASLSRTISSWEKDEASLSGVCGEVMRAFDWHARDIGAPAPNPQEMLRRLGMPITDRTVTAAAEWLDSLPDADAVRTWDLAYIEQRLGCWAGPASYGNPQMIPPLAPLNSRRIYSIMLGLPDSYRLNAQSCRDFIRVGWPELARYPFNSPFGLDRLRFLKAQGKAILPRRLRDPIRRLVYGQRR